jgi:uncharacterized membrane protein YhaH (DUF805 family)
MGDDLARLPKKIGKSMNSANPYMAPKTVSHVDVNEYSHIKVFSTAGRLGRVRYIGYSIGLSFLALIIGSIAVGAFAVMMRPTGTAAVVLVSLLPYVFMYAVQIMLTIQRSHDFNMSGWLSLLVIVPLAGFIFWFIPGTDGPNRWGHKTPPNTTGVIILAFVIPVIMVVGIVAAIAIPSYQKYVNGSTAPLSQTK